MLNEAREFVLLVHQDSKAVKVVSPLEKQKLETCTRHKLLDSRVLIGFVREKMYLVLLRSRAGGRSAPMPKTHFLFVPYCINIFVNFAFASTKNTRDKY